MNHIKQEHKDFCPCGYKKKNKFIDRLLVVGIIGFSIYYVFFKGKLVKIYNKAKEHFNGVIKTEYMGG